MLAITALHRQSPIFAGVMRALHNPSQQKLLRRALYSLSKFSHSFAGCRAGLTLLLATGVIFSFAARTIRTADSPLQPQRKTWPTKQELWRSLRRSGRLTTVYPSAPAALAGAYRDHYAAIQQRFGGRMRQRFLSDREFAADSLAHLPLTLVGTMRSNRLLEEIWADLPIQSIAGGFRFRGVDYRDSTDVLYLMYPNPRNRTLLLSILTGNSDGAILRQQKQNARFYNRLGDYAVFRDCQAIAIGFFEEHGPRAWEPEAALAYDLLRGQKTVLSTRHFSFITHGNKILKDDVAKLAQREEQSLQNLITRLRIDASRSAPKLTIHLWDSLEEKGMFTGETRLAHTDESRQEVHLAFTPELRSEDFMEEAQWCIGRFIGQTASPAIREGLAVALSNQWRGVGHVGWAARLVQTGNAPKLGEIFESAIWAAESDLVRQPLLGSFADFLLQRWGAEKFLSAYRGWPAEGFPSKFPNGDSQEELLAEWEIYLRTTPAIPLRHQQTPEFSPADFHRGFCYAHEGYQIRNGYLGSLSKQSIAELARLHVNAISVTPFGYLRAPDQPDFLRRSSGARAESDESLVQAKIFADDHGIRVMLKPHILMMGGGWGWPGAIRMHRPEDWEIFFDCYARWMLHYAMLAEMYDFDSLCIGVELVQASYQHEAAWREMIKRWRGIYSGPIFYAANWGDEFEKLTFWDALDAIGLNCYYPLSDKENPTDAELLAGARRIAGKIEVVAKKFHKPVVVSEIGFTSSARTWLRPHEDKAGMPLDLEAQRRCYEAMFRTLWGRPWLAGIYWWKWPTTLDDGGMDDDGFTPNGKLAAAVVAKWYGMNAPNASGMSPQ